MKINKKQFNLLSIIVLALLSLPTFAFAQGDTVRGGGGEDGVFKNIRDEVGAWLEKSAQIGKLEDKLELQNISGEKLLSVYSHATQSVGDKVVFTHDQIKFGNNVRICMNDRKEKVITCNIEAWNATRGDTRYMMVFHEYLGIAGIETNIAEYSRYAISPKILGYIKSKQSYELGMDKVATNDNVAPVKMLMSDLAKGSELKIVGSTPIVIPRNRGMVKIAHDNYWKGWSYYDCKLYVSSVSAEARIIPIGTSFKIYSSRYDAERKLSTNTLFAKSDDGTWNVFGAITCENVVHIDEERNHSYDLGPVNVESLIKLFGFLNIQMKVTTPESQNI